LEDLGIGGTIIGTIILYIKYDIGMWNGFI